MDSEEIADRFFSFEEWTGEEIMYLIDELTEDMARDAGTRFDGYSGASSGLYIARAFLELGDAPEANQQAVEQFAVLARYALNSTYWGNETAPARPDDCDAEHRTVILALEAVSQLAPAEALECISA
jgi:hypothetical protein